MNIIIWDSAFNQRCLIAYKTEKTDGTQTDRLINEGQMAESALSKMSNIWWRVLSISASPAVIMVGGEA